MNKDQEIARLKESVKELSKYLDHAITCIEWCRKNHTNLQSGDGVPVEIFYRASIEKAAVLL